MKHINAQLKELEIDFPVDSGIAITRYPYRTARVLERITTLPREKARALEQTLIYEVGAWPDNHVVYGITTDEGPSLYLLFTDFDVVIGHKVEERAW